MGRSAHRVRRTGWRFAAAGLVAAAATVAPSEAGSAATVSDSATVTVTLDSPGTVTLDGFDPARGRLTGVALSLRADVLVQVCIENTGPAPAPIGAGTATASLTAEFPGGANRTVADVAATVAAADVAASNGTADCAGGFDAATGRFVAAVTAADATYTQQTDQTTNTATLTTATALAPFNRAGTITVAYTPQNDTELALPAAWGILSVARGELRATITYTYTPASSGGGGSNLPFTGSTGGRIATLAVVTVLAGIGAVLIAKRRRTNRTTPPATH
jgi:hypothetical protein